MQKLSLRVPAVLVAPPRVATLLCWWLLAVCLFMGWLFYRGRK